MSGYQQGRSPYGPLGSSPQAQYGQPQQGGYQSPGAGQDQGYFVGQGQPGMSNDGPMGALSSQMGNVGLGNDAAMASRPQKKKNRHAYHNLEQPANQSQAFSGPPQGMVDPGQYAGSDKSQQMGAGHPYAGQQVTPAMNQFPAQGGAPFSPGLQGSDSGFGPTSQQLPTPSGPSVSGQGKVDPEQIPSVPRTRDAAAQFYLDHVYPTMEQHLPPPSVVPFVAQDQGNSSPKYARLTLNSIPATSEALASTALPLGLLLQPLASLQAGEQDIPVLDFGDTGPPRCHRCRTYINPFMTFRSGGNKLVCNMCTFPNDVSPEYFAPTDPSGVRVDRMQRPELTTGTVEFMVPKEYWAKPPVGLHWLFLIDVSQEAVNRGLLRTFCQGVLNALYEVDEEVVGDEQTNGDSPLPKRNLPQGAKVGFATFDQSMHFYNCNVGLPSLPVVQDLTLIIIVRA